MAEHTYQSLAKLPARQIILICLDQQRAIRELTEQLARLERPTGQVIRNPNTCPYCGYTKTWELPRRRQCKRCRATWAKEE